MYIHLPLPSSPFLFFVSGKCVGEIHSQHRVSYTLSVWSIRNVSGILPTAQSEFISAHFTSSGKTSTAESATTMGKFKLKIVGLNIQNSSHKIMNLWRSVRSARGPLTLAHSVWKCWCRTRNRTHQLDSKSLQRRHAITHPCTPLSPVPSPICPVLLDSSAPPLLSYSWATFKPSSVQLQRWKRRWFRFWTPCTVRGIITLVLCVCVCVHNR